MKTAQDSQFFIFSCVCIEQCLRVTSIIYICTHIYFNNLVENQLAGINKREKNNGNRSDGDRKKDPSDIKGVRLFLLPRPTHFSLSKNLNNSVIIFLGLASYDLYNYLYKILSKNSM